MTSFAAKPRDVDGEAPADDLGRVDFNELIIPRENPLLRYDSVAWNFKLYALKTSDYQKVQNGNENVTQYIISETGGTAKYNIESVEMTTTPPGSNATKNSTLLHARLTLSENGSMTFYDQLQAASSMLGYTQVMDVPLFLELSFKGFDNNGTNEPVTIPGTTKLWRVRFNKIDTRLTNNGGTTIYDIAMTTMSFMTPPESWRLTEPFELTAKSDVRSFIEKFSQRINAIQDSQYGYLTQMFPSKIQPNNYFTFHVHPTLQELVFINDKNQDVSKDKVDGVVGNKHFKFKASDTIGNCIDMIMDATESKGVNQDTNRNMKRQFVHCIPVADYVGYDRFRRKHVYRYDVFVIPFQTLDYQDVDDTTNKNTAYDLKNLLNEAYPGGQFNMKRYDYQWSGLNNEILELDLQFNSAYNMMAPKNIASRFDPYNRRGSKTPDLQPIDPIVTPEKLNELYQRKRELDAKAELTDAEEIESSSINAQFSNISIEGENEQFDDNRAGEVYLENIATELVLDEYTQTYNGSPQNVQVQVDYRNINEVSSGTDDSNASPTELSKRMIKSNYYNDAFLLKLEMNVVGDPYWLGYSEFDTIAKIKSMINSNDSSDVSPDTLAMNVLDCEPCLLLNLHPARGFNEYTGLMEEDPESVFSQGVYRVLSVVSRFEAGSFTQDLNAALITRSVNRKK